MRGLSTFRQWQFWSWPVGIKDQPDGNFNPPPARLHDEFVPSESRLPVRQTASHHRVHELALPPLQAADVLDEDVQDVVLVLPGLAGGVGRNQHVLEAPER